MTTGANCYADWLRWGKVARLAIPHTDFDHHPDILALTAAPVEEMAAA
jgi:hypothetical protein